MRYSEGNAVQADPVEAYTWLSLAAAQGIPDATRAVSDLKSRMTSKQLAEGRQRVRSFTPVATAKPAQ
jgi:TPR repeat protein